MPLNRYELQIEVDLHRHGWKETSHAHYPIAIDLRHHQKLRVEYYDTGKVELLRAETGENLRKPLR